MTRGKAKANKPNANERFYIWEDRGLFEEQQLITLWLEENGVSYHDDDMSEYFQPDAVQDTIRRLTDAGEVRQVEPICSYRGETLFLNKDNQPLKRSADSNYDYERAAVDKKGNRYRLSWKLPKDVKPEVLSNPKDLIDWERPSKITKID